MSSLAGSSTASSRAGVRQRSLAAGNTFLKILPDLKSMIAESGQDQTSISFERLSRDGTKREEIGRVSAALFIIEKYVRNIRQLGQDEPFDNSLSRLIDHVCSLTENKPLVSHTTEEDKLPDTRLLRIQDFIEASMNSDYPINPDRVTLKSLSSQDWAILSEDLGILIDQIQHEANNLTPRILRRDQTNPPPHLTRDSSELLSETFEAMTCVCETKSTREMRVRLGAYKKPESAGAEDVTILTKESVATTWAEIRLHRSLEPNVPKDLDQDSEHGTSQQAAEQQNGQQDRCICGYYQNWFRPQHWRLNVQILGSRLTSHWVDQTRSLPIASLQHQIDLKRMISSQGSTMTGVAKLTLSVILAYSLFYLFGRSWSKVRWKRDHIIFFVDDNNKIPMRAFLKVSEPTQSNKGMGVTSEEIHRHPTFLELAIMLLEINLGQSLEVMLNMDGSIQSLNDSWCAASEVFSNEKWRIEHPGLRDAIDLCLKPDFGMSFADHGDPDHSALRNQLLEYVVRPIERDLEHAFQHFISVDGLDEEAPEKIILPFIRQKTNSMPDVVFPVEDGDDPALRADYTDCTPSSSSPPAPTPKLRPLPFPPLGSEFTLFNNASQKAEELSSALTEKWARRFRQLVRSHISEDRGRRLKVAILDTGISGTHPEFYGDSRIKALKSWTAGKPDVDISGHGTHIASTILSLTLNVDLYIGKITETNKLQNTDIIADAIQFACDEWDVDILSLSFGFSRGVRCINNSIDKAVARNKIVFAAASNDGSNTARAYPASHDRVIAVHSTDGHGNRSAFNPTPIQHDDNFCVLGEHIEGAWSDNGVRRMSGTSFAVPVSVSIASFMIGFISKNAPHHENWLVPLLGFEGVRAIFRLLSERRDSGYNLVNPLAQFSKGGSSGDAFLRAVESILDR